MTALVDVEPIGSHKVFAFVNRGPNWRDHTQEWVDKKDYPETEQSELFSLLAYGPHSPRAIAKMLGIESVDVYHLRGGRKRLATFDRDDVIRRVIGPDTDTEAWMLAARDRAALRRARGRAFIEGLKARWARRVAAKVRRKRIQTRKRRRGWN